MSKARVDLPEPLTPVITMNRLRGSSRSIFLRLCSRAPRIMILWTGMADYRRIAKKGCSGRRLTAGAGFQRPGGWRLRLWFAAPFFLELIGHELEALGAAGPARPQQRAVAEMAGDIGQGPIQVFRGDYGHFQLQPHLGAFFGSGHRSFLAAVK